MLRAFEPMACLTGVCPPSAPAAGWPARRASAPWRLPHSRRRCGWYTLRLARPPWPQRVTPWPARIGSSSSAPEQPPATPDWITSWPRIKQAETSARIRHPWRFGACLVANQPLHRAGRVVAPDRRNYSRMPLWHARQSGGHASPMAYNKNHLRDWSRHGVDARHAGTVAHRHAHQHPLRRIRRGRPARWHSGTACRRHNCARRNTEETRPPTGLGSRHPRTGHGKWRCMGVCGRQAVPHWLLQAVDKWAIAVCA